MAIEIGALNTTAISQARTEKIPMSGPGDPCTTIENLGRAIAGVTIVKVEYGSASDQAATIQAAHDAATAGDVLLFGMGVVKIETMVNITKKLTIIGNGTIFRTTSNIKILNISGSSAAYTKIYDIDFEGNSTGAAQYGIFNASTSYGLTVQNCIFKTLNTGGIFLQGTGITPYSLNIVTGCRAIDCPGSGFMISGAYSKATDCDANNCGIGFDVTTTNLTISGCNASECTVGLQITTSGKCIVLGGHYNHGGTSISVVSATLGVAIIGTNAVTGSISVNDNNVNFSNCNLGGSGINFNSKHVRMLGNIIYTGGLTASNDTNVIYANNYNIDDFSLWTG